MHQTRVLFRTSHNRSGWNLSQTVLGVTLGFYLEPSESVSGGIKRVLRCGQAEEPYVVLVSTFTADAAFTPLLVTLTTSVTLPSQRCSIVLHHHLGKTSASFHYTLKLVQQKDLNTVSHVKVSKYC